MKPHERGPILGTVGTFFGGLLMIKMGHMIDVNDNIRVDGDFVTVVGWFITVISAIITLALAGWSFFHARARRHDQNSYMGVVDKINNTYRPSTKEGDDDAR